MSERREPKRDNPGYTNLVRGKGPVFPPATKTLPSQNAPPPIPRYNEVNENVQNLWRSDQYVEIASGNHQPEINRSLHAYAIARW